MTDSEKAHKFVDQMPIVVLAPLRDLVHDSTRSQCGAWSDTCPDWPEAVNVLGKVIEGLWTAGYHLCLEGERVQDGYVVRAEGSHDDLSQESPSGPIPQPEPDPIVAESPCL